MNCRLRRRELGVALSEVSLAMGPGFSTAVLSEWERNRRLLEPWDVRRIKQAVELIGSYRQQLNALEESFNNVNWARALREIPVQAVGA